MDGWVLHDIYGGQKFTWHGYTLPAASKIRVYTNEVHTDSGGFTFASNDAIWANKGDAAELLELNRHYRVHLLLWQREIAPGTSGRGTSSNTAISKGA